LRVLKQGSKNHTLPLRISGCGRFLRFGVMTKPRGRPSDYSPEKADEILLRLSNGESLNKICQDDGMPSRPTVFAWVLKYPEFLNKYRVARDMQADAMVDDSQDIADAATPENWTVARLRVTTRQWSAARMSPRKYGNFQSVDMTVSKATVKREPAEVEAKRSASKDSWTHSHTNGKANGSTAH
jgi:hypothetical protein